MRSSELGRNLIMGMVFASSLPLNSSTWMHIWSVSVSGCVCVGVGVCQTLLHLYLASVVVHKVVLAFVANVDVVAI